MNGMNNENNNVYAPTNRINGGMNNQNGYFNANDGSQLGNVENKPKKNGNKVFVILLVVLLVASAGFGGWKLGSMYGSNENNVNNQSQKDGITKEGNNDDEVKAEEKNIPEKNSNYTFYKEETAEYNIKNDKVEVLYYYYLDEENLKTNGDESVTKFIIRREAFVKGKSFTDILIVGYVDNKGDADAYITNDLKSATSSYVADTENDDSYLILSLGDTKNLVYDGIFAQHDTYNVNAYLVSKDGTLLKKITVIDAGSSLIGIFINKSEVGDRKTYSASEYKDKGIEVEDNKAVVYFGNNVLDIHDNFIYYVAADSGVTKNLEYKLTINNGVLSEKLINTYSRDDIEAAGAE